MLLDGVKTVENKLTLIADRRNLEVRRKSGDDVRHPFLHVVDYGDRVRSGLFANTYRNRCDSIEGRGRRRFTARLFHTAHVLDLDRESVTGRDDDVIELLDLSQFTHRPKAKGPLAFDQIPARQFLVLRANGVSNFGY